MCEDFLFNRVSNSTEYLTVNGRTITAVCNYDEC
jgi:hypothetical protein